MESPIKHTDDTCPEIDSKGFCAAVFASSAQLCGRFARFFGKEDERCSCFFPFFERTKFSFKRFEVLVAELVNPFFQGAVLPIMIF